MGEWIPGLDWLRQVGLLVGAALAFAVFVFVAERLCVFVLHLPWTVNHWRAIVEWWKLKRRQRK